MARPREVTVNSGIRKNISSQRVVAKKVILPEVPTSRDPLVGKGSLWVRNDSPNVLVFTDDAGTDVVLNSAAGPTPGLTQVLTAGNDGGGLDVLNIGIMTFDTAADTKGITIGTVASPASSTRATQVVIGGGAACSSAFNIGSVVIGNGSVDSSISYLANSNNVLIGNAGSISGIGTYESVVIGDASASQAYAIAIGAGSQVGAQFGIAIGQNATCSGLNSIAIGVAASASHDDCVAVGRNVTTTADDQFAVAVGNPPTIFRTGFTVSVDPIVAGSVVLANATAMLQIQINGVQRRIALFV